MENVKFTLKSSCSPIKFPPVQKTKVLIICTNLENVSVDEAFFPFPLNKHRLGLSLISQGVSGDFRFLRSY